MGCLHAFASYTHTSCPLFLAIAARSAMPYGICRGTSSSRTTGFMKRTLAILFRRYVQGLIAMALGHAALLLFRRVVPVEAYRAAVIPGAIGGRIVENV